MGECLPTSHRVRCHSAPRISSTVLVKNDYSLLAVVEWAASWGEINKQDGKFNKNVTSGRNLQTDYDDLHLRSYCCEIYLDSRGVFMVVRDMSIEVQRLWRCGRTTQAQAWCRYVNMSIWTKYHMTPHPFSHLNKIIEWLHKEISSVAQI